MLDWMQELSEEEEKNFEQRCFMQVPSDDEIEL